MKKKLLIIEDEAKMRLLLKDYFIKDGFDVQLAEDGDVGLHLFNIHPFDIILLDIMMPKIDGITVLDQIRETSQVPVILITAKGQEEDKLFGFEMGADDYITKPFSPKVLVAKVRALLKRTPASSNYEPSDFNGLIINTQAHEVKINDEEILLTPKEYELLVYLCNNKGISLSRDTILDNVWGIDYYGDIRTVDTNIKRLREKLHDKASMIKTVRGSGYKFES